MVIDFKFTGLGAAVQQMNSAGKAATGMNAALVGRGSRSGTSSATTGPMGNYIKAFQQLNKAVTSGSAIGAFDAQINVIRKWNSLQRLPQWKTNDPFSNINKGLKNLVYSTRIGFGSGGTQIMPLFGRLIGMLGELGPVGLAAAIGIGALIETIKAGISAGVAFGSSMMVGGGTAGQTGQLASFATAAGMDLGQATGLGKAYNRYLIQNPLAGAYGQQHGFGANYVGPFGDINDTGRLLAGLKDLLFNPNEMSVRRRNYGGPLEGLEWMRNASPDVKAQMFKQQQFQLDPKFLRETADAQIQLNIAMGNFQWMLVQLSKTVDWEGLNLELKLFGDIARGLSGGGWDFSNLHDKKAQAEVDAMNKHTDAMNNHARALDSDRHLYGNAGQGARGSVPSGYYSPTGNPRSRSQMGMGQVPLG